MRRKGRPEWTTTAPRELVERANEAVDAGRSSARDIWLALGLNRYCRASTFRHYASRRLRMRAASAAADVGYELSDPPAGTAAPQRQADAPGVLQQTLGAMYEALLRGEVPAYSMPQYVRAMLDVARMDIEVRAEQRAAELHTARMADLQERQQTALEGAAKAVRLTSEQVVAIREQVLGLVAEPKAAPAAPSSEAAAA